MRLVLCSEGFATPNTVQACVELCDKPRKEISAAIINEASAVEKGDKRWVLQSMNAVADNLAGEFDIINLLALSPEDVLRRLVHKDVIFGVGGNPDYLMSVFQKTRFDETLRRLLESKVYVGSSAGAMVMGRRLPNEVYRQIYGEESTYDIEQYLGFVDFSVMPHLDSPEYPHTRNSLIKAVGSFAGRVYGLRDDSAIVVRDHSIRLIGSEPVTLH